MMAARIFKIAGGKSALDVWASAPTLEGTKWERFVPFGLSLDWGLGGYVWFGWSWSGQVCVYLDRH